MKPTIALFGISLLVTSCATSTMALRHADGPSANTRQQAPSQNPPVGPTIQEHSDNPDPAEASEETSGSADDPNLLQSIASTPYDVETPRGSTHAIDTFFGQRADSAARSDPVKSNEKNSNTDKSPVIGPKAIRRIRTDSIFAYVGQSNTGGFLFNVGLVLDNGQAYVWRFGEGYGDSSAFKFSVSNEVHNNLTEVLLRQRFMAFPGKTNPCSGDQKFLFLATQEWGRRYSNCGVFMNDDAMRGGYWELSNKLEQLLGLQGVPELDGQPVGYKVMLQSVRNYLGALPSSDMRRVQIQLWLNEVNRAMQEADGIGRMNCRPHIRH